MLSPAAQYQRMQQSYLQRPTNLPDRFQYLQQYKPNALLRPPNTGHELLTKLEQAGKVPSREKFRRMCCQTFLSTGGCPYNDRCVFLHDPRLHIESFRLRTVKNVRQSGVLKDTFYWPDMERGDVSLLLDAQGLPDAKQAYTIPKDFSLIPHASHHDRALYSMWNHFIDACVEGDLLQNSSCNLKGSASTMMSEVSSGRLNSSVTASSTGNNCKNTSYLSPSSQAKQMGQHEYEMASPMSVATAMFSPQGKNSFSTPGTPIKPIGCRLTALSEMRAQSDISSVSKDLSLDFKLALNDHKRSIQQASVWELNEDIDTEANCNKHLKGVWRLPIFITLSGGARNANRTHSTQTRTANINIKFGSPTAPPPGPMRLNSSPAVIKPVATRTPGRMQPSVPPTGSYPGHDRGCQLHDLNNEHQNHQQRLEFHHRDSQERHKYPEALRATAYPAVMTRSTPMQSPDRQFKRAYVTSTDSGDDHLTHFILPRPAYYQTEQVYNRDTTFSFDQVHRYGAPIVQNGYYEQQARELSRNENNLRPTVIDRDPINQPRQQYGGELSSVMKRHDILKEKSNDFDTLNPHNFSVPHDEFLLNFTRDSESFQPNRQQSYDFNDVPHLNSLMPAQQSGQFKTNQDHGNWQGEPVQEYQVQYNHTNEERPWTIQKEPRLELTDPAVMGCIGGNNIRNSSLVTNVATVDRWNDGYDREPQKNAAVVSTAASDWAGTPSSQTELTSNATMDTSWESINSAFFHHQVVEFSPSTDSFTSDISECADKWMPFGDVVLCQPLLESLAIERETASKDNGDVMCSEKDD